MPAKNRLKTYAVGGVYHIYNRGYEGREVFKTDEDFNYFKDCLRRYAGKYEEVTDPRYKSDRPYIRQHKREMNLAGEVAIWAYCLLPDHFHLLVHQSSESGMVKLMRRVMTNYVMYFNRRYHRKGILFENVYRAVLVPDEERVVSLSKYIHLNPAARVVKKYGLVATISSQTPEYYMYSSYPDYVGERVEEWVETHPVLKKLEEMGF